uniref:Cwf19-like C-terminal domain-containing protein n=1 Tax=Glossina palpalis gambiensis TaxID=67801 RepID=A0A1B0B669_9MUSC
MDNKIKILVVGDVCGRFKQLFQRLESINKKSGPFEILLCVGNFFSDSDKQNEELIAYKNACKTISVPTYILGPTSEVLNKNYKVNECGEICTNLSYLGKRGLYSLSSGVKIAYVSGREKPPEDQQCEAAYYFTKDDIIAVRNLCFVNKSSASDYRGIDILLTSQGPYGLDEQELNSSKLVSFLCKEIKPRYHFHGLSKKYKEPAPFRLPADQTTQLELCTRVISLAAVGNENKEKYIYALSLTPVHRIRVLDLIQKTTNELKCPFADINYKDVNITKEEKHLIITIGEHFYLALAKGPVNDYHILILSITHIPAASQITNDEEWEELLKFKDALRKFFKDQQQVVCFTERNYKSSHLQINCFGIDAGYSWKISHAFEDKAEEFELKFENLKDLNSPQMLPSQGPYFVAELSDDTILITRQMKHFPLHFARDVFCSPNLLNCEEKTDWRDCKLEKAREVELVQNFREKFSKYDFAN